jgi:hypothetical protein
LSSCAERTSLIDILAAGLYCSMKQYGVEVAFN